MTRLIDAVIRGKQGQHATGELTLEHSRQPAKMPVELDNGYSVPASDGRDHGTGLDDDPARSLNTHMTSARFLDVHLAAMSLNRDGLGGIVLPMSSQSM